MYYRENFTLMDVKYIQYTLRILIPFVKLVEGMYGQTWVIHPYKYDFFDPKNIISHEIC